MAVYGASRLAQVDPDLVRLVVAVGVDRHVQVIAGARTIAEEQSAINSGHSHLKNAVDSYHVLIPGTRPLALAVDLAPWPVNWANRQSFLDLGAAVKAKAAALGVTPFSWGGDWPHPFDWGHFQKAPAPV